MNNTDYKKYSGAGNNFLMVNNIENRLKDPGSVTVELIEKEKGENFDGVIFLENSDIADFKMNYYNKDGTGDALCGNGLRCTVKYILDNNFSDRKELTIEAVKNIYGAEYKNDDFITIHFPPPKKIKLKFKLKVQFLEWWSLLTASYFDVGAPHLIVFIDNIEKPLVKTLDEVDIDNWGKNLRMHKDLMPEGTNVNFVEVISVENSEIAIRTFERGVEGETLACGTGSISSALSAYAERNLKPPVKIHTRSKKILTVNFKVIENKIRNLTLSGPAEELFSD